MLTKVLLCTRTWIAMALTHSADQCPTFVNSIDISPFSASLCCIMCKADKYINHRMWIQGINAPVLFLKRILLPQFTESALSYHASPLLFFWEKSANPMTEYTKSSDIWDIWIILWWNFRQSKFTQHKPGAVASMIVEFVLISCRIKMKGNSIFFSEIKRSILNKP